MTYQVRFMQNTFSSWQYHGERPLNTDMLSYEHLKQLPKVDLHRHLEGSLRLETLVETARRHNMDVPQEIEALRPYVQVTNDPPDALSFLAKFEILRRFYRTPETVQRLAYEVVADAAQDNVKYLELRFSPQALSKYRGFPLDEATDWVIDAINKASEQFKIEVNLIVTLVRHDPLSEAQRVAEIAFDRIGRGIVGLDLAGDEINHPSLPFKDLFQEAKQLGMGVTIHAGEWRGAQAVRTAIEDIGADRIGHGVRSVEDPAVLDLIKERNTALEICLTSNMQTASIHNLSDHPIKRFWDHRVPVTLNTDDPTISNITLTDEYATAVKHLGFSYSQLRNMMLTALSSSFATVNEKKRLNQYFVKQWPASQGDDDRYLNGHPLKN